MRPTAFRLGLLTAAVCLEIACTSQSPETAKKENPAAPAPAATASACTLPTTMASSNEETAWQIFVAANCAANGKLKWETWTEQSCFSNPSGPGCGGTTERKLHASRLGVGLRRKSGKLGAPETTPGGCSPMVTNANAPANLKPFVPKNLSANAEFCEEVMVEASEAAFVKAPAVGATLTNLAGQVAYAKTTAIAFPTSSVEIKADWLPAASVNNSFNCTTSRPSGVYVETISGTCYALVGIHVSSKLMPNWLWATFEPQNAETNPNRCNPSLYNACNDPWGSNPATSSGAATEPTAALTALMTQAGLPKEFLNYRLVGAQTEYLDANNNPVQLGNSFVEFNAQVPPHQASCMTCHSYAMVSSNGQENPNFGNFPGTPAIGTPGQAPPPSGGGTWIPQDFSWMLGIMPAKAAN